MKIIAAVDEKEFIVQMSKEEIANFAGIGYSGNFSGKFNVDLNFSKISSLVKIQDIPVSKIYEESKATITAYDNLKTSFKSIQTQLATLLSKMEAAKVVIE